MEILIAFVIAFTVWWACYTFKCSLNDSVYAPDDIVFVHFYHDIRCNLPTTGWQYRLELAKGDEDLAKKYPGKLHFFWAHIALPVGIFYLTYKSIGG